MQWIYSSTNTLRKKAICLHNAWYDMSVFRWGEAPAYESIQTYHYYAILCYIIYLFI